jgi:hypothetical protein
MLPSTTSDQNYVNQFMLSSKVENPLTSPVRPIYSADFASDKKQENEVYGFTEFIDSITQKGKLNAARFSSWDYLIKFQYKNFCNRLGYPAVNEDEFMRLRQIYRPHFKRLLQKKENTIASSNANGSVNSPTPSNLLSGIFYKLNLLFLYAIK